MGRVGEQDRQRDGEVRPLDVLVLRVDDDRRDSPWDREPAVGHRRADAIGGRSFGMALKSGDGQRRRTRAAFRANLGETVRQRNEH
jgi:hypothetical protein